MRKGCARTTQNRNFIPVLDDRISFRAKGLRRTTQNRNFTPVFDDRTSFRAKGVSFRGASLTLLPEERNRKEKERRGQEGKRARGQEKEDVKT